MRVRGEAINIERGGSKASWHGPKFREKRGQSVNKLEPGTAHLWVADLASVDERTVEDYRILLSEEELDRAQRFRFQRDRLSFVVSHGLLRTALTWLAPGNRPEDWIFAMGANGRPEINMPDTVPWPRFNISHTAGSVACVVTAEIDCGVDVESVRPLPDLEALSRRVLTPTERAHIAALPDDERLCSFFRLWTLKEAYAKARGLGVLLSFERLCFEWNEGGIRLDIDPVLDDGAQWYFDQWQAPPGYMLSVALRRGAEGFREMVHHTALPLRPHCSRRRRQTGSN